MNARAKALDCGHHTGDGVSSIAVRARGECDLFIYMSANGSTCWLRLRLGRGGRGDRGDVGTWGRGGRQEAEESE